jgi:hypothetical protein
MLPLYEAFDFASFVDPPGVIAPGILMIIEKRGGTDVIIRRECGTFLAMLK